MDATGLPNSSADTPYTTVEDREMAAWRESNAHAHELGDTVMDDELLQELADMRDEL